MVDALWSHSLRNGSKLPKMASMHKFPASKFEIFKYSKYLIFNIQYSTMAIPDELRVATALQMAKQVSPVRLVFSIVSCQQDVVIAGFIGPPCQISPCCQSVT